MAGFCECGIEPSGFINWGGGVFCQPGALLASQEGLFSMKLLSWFS